MFNYCLAGVQFECKSISISAYRIKLWQLAIHGNGFNISMKVGKLKLLTTLAPLYYILRSDSPP